MHRFINLVLVNCLLLGTPLIAQTNDRADELYLTYCSSCHGLQGDGKGPAASALSTVPRDFTDSNWQSGASNDRIARVITDGGIATGLSYFMPAWQDVLSKEDIALLVAKIKAFAPPSNKPRPQMVWSAQNIYTTFCIKCHGPAGQGDGPLASQLPQKPRDFSDKKWATTVSDERLKTVIRKGGHSVGLNNCMPGWGSQFDTQMDGLIKRLRDFAEPIPRN
jgi:cbb3-type cytochrome c oxidase subunit III